MNQKKFASRLHCNLRTAEHYETAYTSPSICLILLLIINQRFRLIILPADTGNMFGFLPVEEKMDTKEIQRESGGKVDFDLRWIFDLLFQNARRNNSNLLSPSPKFAAIYHRDDYIFSNYLLLNCCRTIRTPCDIVRLQGFSMYYCRTHSMDRCETHNFHGDVQLFW